MFHHLIKRVIRWGNRTVTIYISPEEGSKKPPGKSRSIGLKLFSLFITLVLVTWVRWFKGD